MTFSNTNYPFILLRRGWKAGVAQPEPKIFPAKATSESFRGSGTAGGGGGTAAVGLERGLGAPGLPAQTPVFKINCEAKPIQTAPASYPPMALRMGMEGDVTIKIEVDTEGKVARPEIIKGAGAGFDEEALKAVKQSRFEPAQIDRKTVPAEFTYIYHFRLAK